MAANTQNNDVEIKSQSTDTPEDCVLSFSAKQINLNKNFAMEPCRKCGSELSDRDLSCPNCGASLSLDVSLSVAAMKVLGVLCGVVGVALLVYAEEIDGPHPYGLWLWAGAFTVMGFVFFYRKWSERDDSHLHSG